MTTAQNFLPHTPADRQAMLAAIGLDHPDELFVDIPEVLREAIAYNTLPAQGLSEAELQQTFEALAAKNKASGMACFLGGGAYNRFIPPAVNTIASRSEFYTAYTPYQPEISQGTLQVVYEFQSMIAELTGMDVANASVYDGGSAVTEAALMALRISKRNTIILSKAVHPDARAILQTYVNGLGGIRLETLPKLNNESFLQLKNPEQVACVVVQVPDVLGCLSDLAAVQAFCQVQGALLVVSADPVSLGCLAPPGAYGADIVVGDIQPLGNALCFGGPYGGYMACKEKYMRQLPGRLVGKTVDQNGTPCYTLTLQTREQHIRREKATSNICTNQALNVLKATVYLALMGPEGLRQVAEVSAQRAHWLARQLCDLHPEIRLLFHDDPFWSEFALQLPIPAQAALKVLEEDGIVGGFDLSRWYPEYPNTLLISVTEQNTPEQLSAYVNSLARVFQQTAGVTAGSSRA